MRLFVGAMTGRPHQAVRSSAQERRVTPTSPHSGGGGVAHGESASNFLSQVSEVCAEEGRGEPGSSGLRCRSRGLDEGFVRSVRVGHQCLFAVFQGALVLPLGKAGC